MKVYSISKGQPDVGAFVSNWKCPEKSPQGVLSPFGLEIPPPGLTIVFWALALAKYVERTLRSEANIFQLRSPTEGVVKRIRRIADSPPDLDAE
ncbi:hypothetical protein O181_115456, partial [Austropuccinia psidii MF-1]|nr:hypothetical protein [Austropuccinia psidii MF-1]